MTLIPYIKQVDRKAPRFRVSKFRYNIVNPDLYKAFIKETKKDITYKQFKEIVKAISLTIMDLALEERSGVLLPEQMGKISLGLFNLKEKSVDMDAYMNQKQLGYSHKLETSGLTGKIVWNFRGVMYKVRNNEMYGFIAHRLFKTRASKAFIGNPEKYIHNRYAQIKQEKEKNRKLKKDEQIDQGITE